MFLLNLNRFTLIFYLIRWLLVVLRYLAFICLVTLFTSQDLSSFLNLLWFRLVVLEFILIIRVLIFKGDT